MTDIKCQGVEHMTTIETALRGRIPLVNLDERSPIPLSFVFELSHKLAPSHIRDGLRKFVVLYHILDVQTLDAYDLVLTSRACVDSHAAYRQSWRAFWLLSVEPSDGSENLCAFSRADVAP